MKCNNKYLELEQLLSGEARGERGERAAEDDCLRNFVLLRGLPSRSWLRSGDKCVDLESRLLLDDVSREKNGFSLAMKMSF